MANSPMDAAAIVQAYLSSPQFLNTIANIVQGIFLMLNAW